MKKAFFFVVAALLCSVIAVQTTSCTDKKVGNDSIMGDSAGRDTSAFDSLEKIIEETQMPKAADELFDDFVCCRPTSGIRIISSWSKGSTH